MPVLLVPEPSINIAPFEKLFVAAAVVDSAALEHEHRVGRYQHREAVGNDDESAAFGNPQQICIDDRLAFSIEGAGRLVEDQDARIPDQRARYRQSLPLTARKVCRAFLDVGLVASRQMFDDLFRAGQPGSEYDVFETRIGLCRGNCLADRTTKQEAVLQHPSQAQSQMIDIDLPQIIAV